MYISTQDGDNMKIKEVCEKTGLSDKTIRYYIRSGLVFPKYNENYTGRKNFDFAENDIERLKQVAVLRKYGFSINSIKSILSDCECIDTVIKEHIHNMKEETENSVKLLSRLNDISDCQFSDARGLCSFLAKAENLPATVPSIDNTKPYKLLYSKNKKANKALIVLVLIVFLFSAIMFSELYNTVRCITDSSIIDINNAFIGIRVIETDNKNNGTQYVNDLYIEDDCLITESDKFDECSTSIEKSFFGRDTITINAVVHSDKAMVKITPIYENKYSDELIYCNSSYWLGLDSSDGVNVKSQFKMQSKNYNYQYNIEFIPY